MAASPKKITVAVTPGQNRAVPHVFALEDLLGRMNKGTAKARRGRDAGPGGAGPLLAELEARLRELRELRAVSARTPAPSATRRGLKRT
jgi:hypothetical protein